MRTAYERAEPGDEALDSGTILLSPEPASYADAHSFAPELVDVLLGRDILEVRIHRCLSRRGWANFNPEK